MNPTQESQMNCTCTSKRRVGLAAAILFIGITTVLLLPSSGSAGGKLSPPKLQSSQAACAGYAVEKRAFMVSRQRVEGESCSVSTRIEEVGKTLVLEASFQPTSLDSGDRRRDEHVAGVLSSKRHKDIRFTSQKLAANEFAQWASSKHPKPLNVPGKLSVGGRTVPITFSVIRNSRGLAGVVYTSFSKLGLEPPNAGGGVVAKVYDPLTIAFRVRLDKVDLSKAPVLRASLEAKSEGGEG
ncbi:YceI family protein [Persicimonas caeni]|uniref:YceI family protein n=1 Tax=Persicimonas caeni TaxID=2292766 RepID=A0A4Y6PYV7_PERCE|nr:YceI family protein [Persicimonas caeni]QDG53502.1 YceI family protein [Persicimonas caeni]QED34723.1 YceI family protein [Persicimonas caeni]